MTRFFIAVIFFFLSHNPLRAQSIDTVYALVQRGELVAAREACKVLLETHRNDSVLRMLLGDIQLQAGDAHSAIESYTELISRHPQNGRAYAKRGYARYLLRDFHRARLDLIEAAYLEPTGINHFNLGMLEQKAGKISEALKSYRAALRLDPTLTDVYRHRADLYMFRREYPLAIRDIDSALKYSQFDAALFVKRGTALIGLRRGREAVNMFNRSLRLSPGNATAYAGRGRAYIDLREYRLAVADLDTALSIDKTLETAWLNRGLAHLELSPKHTDEACNDFRHAAALGQTEALDLIRKYCQ
jgi:serine/threonine-protein kinase